ncbi:hypothetical protein [Fredinandcohnia sp. 179-A 10B2 NHS]|uniref:hypothetical protein n=1 Tax=Fredinandcohnia sp. 179-A 10B2 NHS TaxID=3235176 RepID=UPI0039A015AA
MKKSIIALLLVILVIVTTLFYFSFPLSSKSVLPHSTQIEHIYFSNFNGDWPNFYLIEFNDKDISPQQMIQIFDSVSYTRSFGSKNIRNDGNTFSMHVFYRNQNGEILNYDLDINEKGYIVSDKKRYKMVENEQEVFQQLSDWLLEKGVEQPIEQVPNGN